MSLLFDLLSRLVITFLPRGKCILISWQQSPSAVILEPKKIKSLTVSSIFPGDSDGIKRLPTMREIQVQSLGQEDLLEKEMATHSSIHAWKIPWMEEPGRLQSMWP